jgi:hypothetical protein
VSTRHPSLLRVPLAALLAALLFSASARADETVSAAEAKLAPTAPGAHESADLRSLGQRSTRNSAYTLPSGMWTFDLGMLGVTGDDLYGRLGAAVGLNHGFQIEANLGHWIAGLFGISARWNFLDTKRIALRADLGVVYAHGAWLWVLNDIGQKVVADSDLIAFPVGLTMTLPCTEWLEFDLAAQYQYSEVYGSVGTGERFYADTQFGARQFLIRPNARVFLSESTAFEFAARLPAYNKVPYEIDSSVNLRLGRGYSNVRDGYAQVDFSQGWGLEFGVRSRIRKWLFLTTRLDAGPLAKRIYGAPLYPSFNLEFRVR